MTVATLAVNRMVSPAVFREKAEDAVEIVLTGFVRNRKGEGIGGAVLQVHGIQLTTDECGGFELLLQTPLTTFAVTVEANGYAPAEFYLEPLSSSRLSDGTLLAVYDLALDSKAE